MRICLIVVLALLLALVNTHATHVVSPPDSSQKPQELRKQDTCALLSCWRNSVIPVSLGHSAKRKAAEQPDASAPHKPMLGRPGSNHLQRLDRRFGAGATAGTAGGPGQISAQTELRHLGKQDCPITDAGTRDTSDPQGARLQKGEFCNSL